MVFGAYLQGWLFYHKIQSCGSGGNKMVEGSTNMVNEAVTGKTAERMVAESRQNTDFDGPRIDENMQLVLDGASQVDESLPNKQDVRNVADGAELTGDVIKVGGIAATVGSGGTASPGSLPAIEAGEVISNIGLGINLSMDILEGDIDKFSQRLGVEVISFGFGSFVKQSGAGDKVMVRATELIAGEGSEKIIESVPKEEDKK